jgi:hypothetical protein
MSHSPTIRPNPKNLFLVSVATPSKGACREAFSEPATVVAAGSGTGLGNAKEALEERLAGEQVIVKIHLWCLTCCPLDLLLALPVFRRKLLRIKT